MSAVARELGRLRSAGLREDRMAAVEALRGLLVGGVSVESVRGLLEAAVEMEGDVDAVVTVLSVVQEALDVPYNVMQFIQGSSELIPLLFRCFELGHPALAFPCLRILRLVIATDPTLAPNLLHIPMAINMVCSALDESRDIVRNEVLVVLDLLLQCKDESIATIMAFENTMQTLMQLILDEGLEYGAALAIDCLQLVNRMLLFNTNKNVFREQEHTTLLPQLVPLLLDFGNQHNSPVSDLILLTLDLITSPDTAQDTIRTANALARTYPALLPTLVHLKPPHSETARTIASRLVSSHTFAELLVQDMKTLESMVAGLQEAASPATLRLLEAAVADPTVRHQCLVESTRIQEVMMEAAFRSDALNHVFRYLVTDNETAKRSIAMEGGIYPGVNLMDLILQEVQALALSPSIAPHLGIMSLLATLMSPPGNLIVLERILVGQSSSEFRSILSTLLNAPQVTKQGLGAFLVLLGIDQVGQQSELEEEERALFRSSIRHFIQDSVGVESLQHKLYRISDSADIASALSSSQSLFPTVLAQRIRDVAQVSDSLLLELFTGTALAVSDDSALAVENQRLKATLAKVQLQAKRDRIALQQRVAVLERIIEEQRDAEPELESQYRQLKTEHEALLLLLLRQERQIEHLAA